MTTPIISEFTLNESVLHKASACDKIRQVMDFAQNNSSTRMVRTASSGIDNNNLVELFSTMLKCLQMSNNSEAGEIIKNLSAQTKIALNKSGTSNSSENKNDVVKISSKLVRDSHFDVDISKDVVSHNNQKVYMVSCYMRDAYLGRYIIKRNYFYTMDRESAADSAYDEILTKTKALKERYHQDVIKVSAVTTQIKTILDGVISEIEIKEDSLGTTVNRQPYDNNSN